ncbi:zinc finger CCCH domain-containing protein 45 [Selaginella moellendorffii]|uniref:zinc finger CCCH domain-containing protein 45 n=1 Tax=Selaginella moellendorffii TaxID=88036 RepID=UPI000D1C289C|nr:zinc finger CCCH domain-containing protein 45 [Selaginella moellendorffii]|eukprot:XP_024531733.1 zinc finger CCCH domain-containing protein 45 [Selaginella moellendorffii]
MIAGGRGAELMGVSPRNGSGSIKLPDLPLERQSSRRKGVEKSILDDIMGDPDDFKELVDPEEDGGRWEDTVKEALDAENLTEAPAPLEVKRSKNQGSERRGSKSHGTRYFIIKSLNHQNLSKSVERGVWATPAVNEDILNEAFQTSERVVLVFSVNMSGYFQGYAEMTSRPGRRKDNLWNDANDGSSPWGGVFSVDWLKLHDLPFQETSHLKNPLDDNKPVKISKDCQELPREVGESLCALIDEGAQRDGHAKRKKPDEDAIGTKRLRGDGGQNGKTERSSQKIEKHTSDKQKAPERITPDKDKDRERDKRSEKDRATSKERDRDLRKNRLPEEDLLNMTYEEYLRRHNRTYQQFGRPAAPYVGPWMGPAGPGMPDPYAMAAWYERRPEPFYGIPPVPYGGMHPFDPTKWRGHPR